MVKDPRIQIPLMIAKPALKKFRKFVEGRNKTSRKINKKSGGDFKNINTAQQRLDSAKEYTSGVINLLKKKKAPAAALKMLKKGFDEVVKRRKEFRNAVAPLFESGMIWAPQQKFAEEVIEECAAFPFGDHDDLVDSTTQAIMRFRQDGLIEHPEDYVDEVVEQKKRIYY